jgi:alkyldihydroxyacetonephosphate synthase
MISKEAIKRGYNRGNYLVGVHTPPGWAAQSRPRAAGTACNVTLSL